MTTIQKQTFCAYLDTQLLPQHNKTYLCGELPSAGETQGPGGQLGGHQAMVTNIAHWLQHCLRIGNTD